MNKTIRHPSQFYSFVIPDGNNNNIDFNQFRNKVVIIVNVASLCGYTPQYKELQQLYEKYHDRGLEILGFPCNQFGNQEPGDESNIASFCQRHFGVTFPIMKKVYVNGDDEHELYTYLKGQVKGVLGFRGVRWNFEKFIVNRDGQTVARFTSIITPLQFETYIVTLLNQHS
ncbi:uncharacterized protein SPAPADRAFT_53580 [Spathaspora passalidarum NRRL Y-27907]|uniref:Glutathione peroxidase n=1 Tax=Spathaspora passalidarum (strain NRRL Y-27907 / 11-Y1) TaxID=619300 RepID=G3AGE1_SPAPN|nr:uncharacterized protein SPAPADRAFT_53580 [Spathaspora passalidarum NRRL Y-27907]EGW35280.1 hypothetical protein SPAPADRAFT_53580 [Spathaspora passalidarum NRRL Y-27907]